MRKLDSFDVRLSFPLRNAAQSARRKYPSLAPLYQSFAVTRRKRFRCSARCNIEERRFERVSGYDIFSSSLLYSYLSAAVVHVQRVRI